MPDVPERLRSALADRYHLEAELGVGGMAIVYLARDLRHDRKVAVKVLRLELAAAIGAQRFLQEIRVTANLQHPQILPLHDSGEADGFLYYVMPHIDGESLRERLTREKQLSVDESLRIATEVADALHYAHRHGVIHRDVKPENILLHDGRALVADFGIALALQQAGHRRLTETGFSFGTPHYMSPEQATADRELDARSDVYSLGCVLYEMLAGDPPHTGSTAQTVIASVVTKQPDPVTEHRRAVPDHVADALHRALEKLPADRFATAAEFAQALADPTRTVKALIGRRTRARHSPRRLISIAGAAVLAGIGLGFLLGWGAAAGPADPRRLTRLRLPAAGYDFSNFKAPAGTMALSPDGTLVVYVGTDSVGPRLFARPFDALEAQPIPGTENAQSPFFSPDGSWIGYFVGNRIYRTPIGGGPAQFVTEARLGWGAAWTGHDEIVFALPGGRGLHAVPVGGGQPRPLSMADTTSVTTSHRFPDVLPGGRHVLFTLAARNDTAMAQSSIAALDLETGNITVVVRGGALSARYTPSGYLVYARPGGALVAQPFDERRLSVTGDPVPLGTARVRMGDNGVAQFAVSATGTLVYAPVLEQQLAVVERDGSWRPLIDERGQYHHPRFAPDGRRVVTDLTDPWGAREAWVLDVAQRTLTRVTYTGEAQDATWAPDGRIVFSSGPSVFAIPADGSGTAEALFGDSANVTVGSWTGDGRWVLAAERTPEALENLVMLSTEEPRREPILATRFSERAPALSPDGRWLAYVSDESGRSEVYVRAFPGPGPRSQVSAGGGQEPVWGSAGRELLYRSAADQLVAVAVATGSTFRVQGRAVLFDARAYASDPSHANYDIHPDGRRFVMIRHEAASSDLVVVQNWVRALDGQRAPQGISR